MSLRYVVFDTDSIPEGNRIPVLNGADPIRFESFDDLDNRINSLENVKNKITFTNLKYMEILLDKELKFEIWEILQDQQGFEYSNLITHTIKINKKIKEGVITIILETNNPIQKGYIQFY